MWWFGCIYAVLTTLLFLLVVRPVPAQAPTAADPKPADVGRTLYNPSVWWLGVVFACYCTAVFALGTFLPTYLHTVRGMALAQAAGLTSITSLMSIFSGLDRRPDLRPDRLTQTGVSVRPRRRSGHPAADRGRQRGRC